ncbi:MAG: hypothetical protein ACR2L2_00745 [Acidobacteriota bacterium]
MTDRLAKRRYGHPVIVGGTDPVVHLRTQQIPLEVPTAVIPEFDERWLQDLVFRHPEILSVGEVEPAFDDPVPLARELPVNGGFVDAVLLNSRGYLTIVEVKLFRNQEARSEVVGQTIEYLAEIASWDVAKLAKQLARASVRNFAGSTTSDLYTHVDRESKSRGAPPIDAESDWLDAVQQNLKAGRVLLLIAGDGIRASVQSMAEVFQGWPQFHFTLALLELRVYRMPGERRLVIPQVIAKTVEVERAVVTLSREARDEVAVVAPRSATPITGRRPRLPSAKDFVALIRANAGEPAASATARLIDWVDREPGLEGDPGASSYNVRLVHPKKDLSLFYVNDRGEIVFGLWLKAQQLNRLDLSPSFADSFYDAIAAGYGLSRAADGSPLGLSVLRYDASPEQLRRAIRVFADQVAEAAPA